MLVDIENDGYHAAHPLLQRVSLGGIVLDIHLFAGEKRLCYRVWSFCTVFELAA